MKDLSSVFFPLSEKYFQITDKSCAKKHVSNKIYLTAALRPCLASKLNQKLALREAQFLEQKKA